MAAPVAGSKYFAQCYALGVTENVGDMINIQNDQGIITDSVKEGPRVRQVERQALSCTADVTAVVDRVTSNVSAYVESCLKREKENDDKDIGVVTDMPPYFASNIIFTFYRFDSQEALESGVESNSITFIILADSERPPLCGIDVGRLNTYEKTHKTLASVVGVLGAIRCNRLRIPFGKSKLTSLLKRAYNAEKNNTNNDLNKPTASYMFIHAFTDDANAEETYHTLTMGRRIVSVIGGGVGPVSRDLAVEKWRLEQDIAELKDELTIARQVHEYKPCIFDQPKPVSNIQEEEQKRINVIRKRREEAREKAIGDMKQKAQEEARLLIQEEEKQSACNLKELEKRLAEKRAINMELQAERGRKAKEFEKHLEKIRKKKEEEEVKAQRLREEIKALEEDLTARQANIAKQKAQLDVLNQDQTKGREMILKERDDIREQRTKLNAERRAQRQQWLKEIEEINRKVLDQVKQLSIERASRASRDGSLPADDKDECEKVIAEDIASIDRYLPKLIQLDDVPEDNEAAEKIRRQLEDYFNQERAAFQQKLDEEKSRREQLERAAENYRTRITEQQNKARKEQISEAIKKEKQLESLTTQVLQYLEHGCRMTKIPSKGGPARKRFFCLSEDRKKINICEMDDLGIPVNRKKPSNSVNLKDIKRVLLGQFSQTFKNYEREGMKKGARVSTPESLMTDTDGAYSPSPTQNITSENVTKYFYRSFTLEFRKSKTLDLVTETDSDFEAWMVALPRLLKDMQEGPVPIEWGVPLEVSGRNGVDKLTIDEMSLCSMNHVTPVQFLNTKKESQSKSSTSFVTVYDVRTMSSLDFLRSVKVHEFLVTKGVIPSPAQGSS
eukprot:PhM_4_TR12000/c0_g1_i1/m.52677